MLKGAPIVILLAEDEPAHAEIVRRSLKKSRIANRMEHVENGQEALNYLYRLGTFVDPAVSPRPGLFLLDLRMPKMDGLEVLKAIKTDPALMSIPVVILTTSEDETDMAKAYEHHANSYMVKPISFDKFMAMMEIVDLYWLMWNQQPEKVAES